MNEKILIGGAWPYANGSLHIGHIAGLLPGDILARYYRAKGCDVYYVSGSDCHGTPVAIRAKQEGTSPEAVSLKYHEEFVECFNKLGFSFDLYGRTSQKEHIDFVRDFHKKLYKSCYVEEKSCEEAYCEQCERFLADRFVIGICPKCQSPARGDQCDVCGIVLDPKELKAPKCSLCKETPIFKESKHLYINLSKLEDKLERWLKEHPNWRKNAIAFTKRYIEEGLRDRALTRDLDWGIDVPYPGYEDKKIYIWAENVLGYLSMSEVVAKQRGENFKELWGERTKHYYVHAKDNIPFHTVILPALLLAEGEGYRLPDEIISNEYLTLEGRKISTSQNWAIWVKDIIERYQADSIRYFLITNGPEKRDTDFSFRAFIHSHNGELLGGYGNLVNRTLVFIKKYWNGKCPDGKIDKKFKERFMGLYKKIGDLIERGQFKEALDELFENVRFLNRYFDYEQPWNTRITDEISCKKTIYHCVQGIVNLAILLKPFLPFSSEKILKWFNLSDEWIYQEIEANYLLGETEVLFERIDPKQIESEVSKLSGV